MFFVKVCQRIGHLCNILVQRSSRYSDTIAKHQTKRKTDSRDCSSSPQIGRALTAACTAHPWPQIPAPGISASSRENIHRDEECLDVYTPTSQSSSPAKSKIQIPLITWQQLTLSSAEFRSHAEPASPLFPSRSQPCVDI